MTVVDIRNSTVGPKHDPYSRTTYSAIVGHHHIKLTCCSLAGIALENDGVVQPFKGQDAIKEFERLIGCTLDAAEQEAFGGYDPDIAAAERAAGWDCNP
jgi:hypothetical protein